MKTWSDKKWFIWSLLIYPITIWGWWVPNNVAYELKIQELIIIPGVVAWIFSSIALIKGLKRIIRKRVSKIYITALCLYFIHFIFPFIIIILAIINPPT